MVHSPPRDLIALYLRITGPEIQFRLDFFDLDLFPDYDLLILIDAAPGGARELPIDAETDLEWEYLLQVPAEGSPEFLDPNLSPIPQVTPRVVRDPRMDTVIIHLLPGELTLDLDALTLAVYLSPKNSKTVADILGPVQPTDPLPGQAPVLLAFWNTFPAYSPAQALRRWDGAHTGPFGERHGLSHLVRGAARFSVPVLLLDLKNGASLSALDSLNVLPEFQASLENQMLQLPDVIYLPVTAAAGDLPFLPPPEALEQNAIHSRESGGEFGLPSSQTLFAPLLPSSPQSNYRLIFQPPYEDQEPAFTTRVVRFLGIHLVQLPKLSPSIDLQTTAEGLTLSIRRMLIEQALDSQGLESEEFIVLGGDFMTSPWGDPQASRVGLQYLGSHPWIHLLAEADLLALEPASPGMPLPIPQPPKFTLFTSSGTPLPTGQDVGQIQNQLLEAIYQIPEGPLKEQVWNAYFALLAPNPPPQAALAALRANYLGQVGKLLAAARWAAAPGPLNDCQGDPDLDGEVECLLANEHLFLLFEPGGARLVLGFVMTLSGPRQWIGPLSQFLVGYSDPFDWDPTHGPAGDPGDIPGAFADEVDRWGSYNPSSLKDGLLFENADIGRAKSFRLSGSEVVVEYIGMSEWPGAVQLPLAIAPESRFSPGWGGNYHLNLGTGALTWAWDGGVSVSAISTAPLSFTSFNQSMDFLKAPEDPNFDYPPGHYLPFPLAVVTFNPTEDFAITLRVDTWE